MTEDMARWIHDERPVAVPSASWLTALVHALADYRGPLPRRMLIAPELLRPANSLWIRRRFRTFVIAFARGDVSYRIVRRFPVDDMYGAVRIGYTPWERIT